MVRTIWKNGKMSVQVDEDQHISRLTPPEVRDLVCQILIFGGKELREEIDAWLRGGKLDTVAEVIHHS